jgi:NAD(P)-dependent dehydrogenase (short-subunit alcohol dehydrogenase family)
MSNGNRLGGKFALVTGGGRGIGRAIVDAFGREGAHVAIAELDPETGQDAASGIERLGLQSLFVQTDVSNKADIDSLVSKVLDTFGRIDILVNNAGIHIGQPFLEVTEELYDRTLNTNLKSQFFCSQAVARHMAKRGSGKIINMSSVSAEIADTGASHYCVGKGGVQMLTRSAALELAEYDIQVNAICPGTTKTKLTPWYDTQDAVDYCQKLVPAGRFANPDEIAGAAVFLASAESSYITGASIVIDGGLMTQ